MKRLAMVLAVVMMMSLCAAAQAATLRVGMECNYAPYNWTQSTPSEHAVPIEGGGYADGYDVRIAQRIADELGMELVIVKTEWDGLVMSLMSGKIDCIIAGMSPTAERQMTIDFTDPYYESELCIVVKADGPFAAAASLGDFSGAKVTGQLNTFHYTVIDQIPGVKKLPAMETFPAMIVALDAGAIDGYISERPGAVSAMASNPTLAYVSFPAGEGFVASPEDVAIAVGVTKGSPLKDSINTVLAGITPEERSALMDECVAAQPLAQ